MKQRPESNSSKRKCRIRDLFLLRWKEQHTNCNYRRPLHPGVDCRVPPLPPCQHDAPIAVPRRASNPPPRRLRVARTVDQQSAQRDGRRQQTHPMPNIRARPTPAPRYRRKVPIHTMLSFLSGSTASSNLGPAASPQDPGVRFEGPVSKMRR